MFKVIQTIHDMPGIQLMPDDPPEMHQLLRESVLNNYMLSEAYQVRQSARPFLQGQSDSPMWTLVEFWGNNHVPFVDYLNRKLGED